MMSWGTCGCDATQGTVAVMGCAQAADPPISANRPATDIHQRLCAGCMQFPQTIERLVTYLAYRANRIEIT
jgi:hypothetical protein